MRWQPPSLAAAALALSVASLSAPVSAAAAPGAPGANAGSPAPGPAAAPRALEGVGVTERLGDRVFADAVFTGPDGSDFRLAEALGRDRPVVLTLVYYDCPMLCGLLLGGLTDGLKKSGLKLGEDFVAVTASFNPKETAAIAADRQRRYLDRLGAPSAAASWPFLVGSPESIRALAQSVGFEYRYDAAGAQYAHVAVVFVLTPEGRLSRYLYGVQFEPRDLRLAVLEAGQGRVGSTLERVLMTCYRWDPASRRYAFFVNAYLKVGGALLLGGVGALLAVLWRRDRRRSAAA